MFCSKLSCLTTSIHRMTSLAQQLKKLAVPHIEAIHGEDKQRPSLLFDPKEASAIDKETFFHLGQLIYINSWVLYFVQSSYVCYNMYNVWCEGYGMFLVKLTFTSLYILNFIICTHAKFYSLLMLNITIFIIK